jgi:hypothetical protein
MHLHSKTQGYFADGLSYRTLQHRLVAPHLFLHKRFVLPQPQLLRLRLVRLPLSAQEACHAVKVLKNIG